MDGNELRDGLRLCAELLLFLGQQAATTNSMLATVAAALGSEMKQKAEQAQVAEAVKRAGTINAESIRRLAELQGLLDSWHRRSRSEA